MAADLLTNWNNGVQLFVPAPGGRLGHLVYGCGHEPFMGWAFGDFNPNPDYKVFVGTIADAEAFERLCEELGIVIRHDTSLFVPFSNGTRMHGHWAGSYTPNEYGAVRQDDLPTREALEAAVNS